MMRAMIFAAGLGTRLKPYTDHHPKALVPVCGVPMLQRVILRLRDAGIDEIVVNVHHFAGQIIDYLHANDDFGVNIHISDESALLLDTGGGILAARRWLGADRQPFLVHNADILTDVSFSDMAMDFESADAQSMLLVSRRETTRYLLFDEASRMRGWTNIATGQVRPQSARPEHLCRYAFGGIHIMSPEIFGTLERYRAPGVPFSIMDYYIDNCREIDICGYLPDYPYYWHDIGKPQSLSEAERMLSMSRHT